jgi:hypothetical protein
MTGLCASSCAKRPSCSTRERFRRLMPIPSPGKASGASLELNSTGLQLSHSVRRSAKNDSDVFSCEIPDGHFLLGCFCQERALDPVACAAASYLCALPCGVSSMEHRMLCAAFDGDLFNVQVWYASIHSEPPGISVIREAGDDDSSQESINNRRTVWSDTGNAHARPAGDACGRGVAGLEGLRGYDASDGGLVRAHDCFACQEVCGRELAPGTRRRHQRP